MHPKKLPLDEKTSQRNGGLSRTEKWASKIIQIPLLTQRYSLLPPI